MISILSTSRRQIFSLNPWYLNMPTDDRSGFRIGFDHFCQQIYSVFIHSYSLLSPYPSWRVTFLKCYSK